MDKKALAELKDHDCPENLPVRYVVTSSIESVSSKRVLFLSFFSQDQKKKKKLAGKADFKVFIWDKSYIALKLQNDGSYKWSKACVENLLVSYWRPYVSIASCYMLADKERISEFFGVDLNSDVYKVVADFQKSILREKLAAKHQRIKDKIDAAMAKVPALPKDFSDWVYNGPFDTSRYIYYKRKGKDIISFCTECKTEFVIPETDRTQKEVKKDNSGVCPGCRAKIVYKPTGTTRRLSDSCTFAIMQKYEDGFVIRYFDGTKEYRKHYRNPTLSYSETLREVYRFIDGAIKVERYSYTYYLSYEPVRWCYAGGSLGSPRAYLYTRNLKNVLRGTRWQYSCLYEFAKGVKYVTPYVFLREYIKRPAIEYFIKFRLYAFVKDYLYMPFTEWEGVNFKGRTFKDVLGIEKPLLLQMQRLDLGREGLKFIKDAFAKGKMLTDHQVKWVLEHEVTRQFITLIEYTTPHKILKYLKAQSNSGYSAKNMLIDWCDYINQCHTLKFDLTNNFVLFPKSLKAKHEEYTLLAKTETLKKFNKGVAKAFERLNGLYSYSDKKFLIRPAKNVEEIISEGHRLKHCVANSYYLGAVADGTKAIMLVRMVDDPESSFFTLDLVLSDLAVNQCRGFENCDMPESVKKFVDTWVIKKLRKEVNTIGA